SDQIATNVLSDVYSSGGVPSFNNFVTKDIKVALEQGGQTIGGWGGSFYFWDFEYKNGLTVGQIINSSHAEQDKFSYSFWNATSATLNKHGVQAAGDILDIISN